MAQQRSFWIPVICGGIILTLGIGARQSFGIFQKPIATDLNVGRELWSFANAFALLLMGLFSPFAGNLADRFGTARTVAGGGVLYVIGMFMIAAASEGVLLTLGNALVGIGMSAAGFGPILGAIGRETPAAWRSSALGIATAGGSFGQFAIVPFASILQNQLDNWHSTMFVLGVVSVAMIPLAFGLRESRAAVTSTGGAMRTQSAKDALAGGISNPGLLAAHNRLFRLRLSCSIHRAASSVLHFRPRGEPVTVRASGFRSRARWLGDRTRRFVQHLWLAPLGMAGRAACAQGHAGAALCSARARLPAVPGSAADLVFRACLRGIAGLSVARNCSAHQRIGRLHVRAGARINAVGDRVLQPPARGVSWAAGAPGGSTISRAITM